MIEAAAEIEIAANVGAVWTILTDFSNWPRWNTDVQKMFFPGRLQPGAVFQWKAGFNITSTLHDVEPPTFVRWTGVMLGIHASHEWNMRSKNHNTIVSTRETWEGFLASLFPGYFRKSLQKSLEGDLSMLKAAAEKR